MIPYIEIPPIHIGPVPIQPFGILVALAIVAGFRLVEWRAKRLGMDASVVRSLANWVVVGGFIGAHVLELVFYYPEELVRRPYALLFLWDGLSSFGGFVGAIVSAVLWHRLKAREQPLLPLADLVVSVLPLAWMLGRAGCAIVHDHPGIPASASNPFAVAFPGGPRYDLGLLELLFTIVLAGVVVGMWRRKLRQGAYLVMVALAYAPVRFALDFLRAVDARYGGLTPAQWACIALFLFGLAMLARLRRRPDAIEGAALDAGLPGSQSLFGCAGSRRSSY